MQAALYKNYINNDGLINLVDKVDSMINEYVKNDATAFYTYDEYEKANKKSYDMHNRYDGSSSSFFDGCNLCMVFTE